MKGLAIVSGGTRGIGAAISRDLKQAGYQVAALYAKDDATAADFAGRAGIAVFKFDVGTYAQCEEGVRMIESDMGVAVEVLVNNAGITQDSTLHKMSVHNWEEVIKNNLTSCFNMSRCVIDAMRERRFGRIINISSANGQSGQFGQSNYAASKAGIFGFTKALALENARHGITVNAIASGFVNTDMLKGIPDSVMESILARIPLGRVAEPDEISRCVLFLADRAAAYITGSTLSINGGLRME